MQFKATFGGTDRLTLQTFQYHYIPHKNIIISEEKTISPSGGCSIPHAGAEPPDLQDTTTAQCTGLQQVTVGYGKAS